MGKGGGGQQYDREYNARMATIAEDQQDMARAYFRQWDSVMREVENRQAEMTMRLLPEQEQLQLERLRTQQTLLPLEKVATEAGLLTDTAQSRLGEAQATALTGLVPQATDYMSNLMSSHSTALGALQDRANIDVANRMGEASADVAQEYGKVRQNLQRTATPYRQGAAIQTLAAEEAKAGVQAKNKARRLAREEEARNYAALATAAKPGGVM